MKEADTSDKIDSRKLSGKELLFLFLVALAILLASSDKCKATAKSSSASFGTTKDYNVEFTLNEQHAFCKAIEDLVLSDYRKNPALLYALQPTEFEQFVAFLYWRKGYQVEVTPKTRDGGKDVIAKYELPGAGLIVCYIECKRYAADNHVGAATLRGLVGAISTDKVQKGIVVTSSTFTKDAIEFAKDNSHRIELIDFENLKKLLV